MYRGRTAWRGTPVIVKTPDEDSPGQATADRLIHEYEVARSLDVDGVVKPLHLERAGSRVAIVAEDTGFVSLKGFLRGKPVGLPRFFSISSQIVLIVGRIHDRGVVHRDLRPENILINPASGRIGLTGFSRAVRILPGAEGAAVPVASGSPAYMAPEQTGRVERAADHRSDLYSLGVIMFEMLTGRLPLEARDPAGWVYALVARRPKSPGESSPGIPPALSAIVMKLLSKNPEDRYQGAYGLLWDIEECRRRLDEAGAVEPFPLGGRDVPARLRLPRRLFGRRRESDALSAAFAAVCEGTGGVMLVRGFAGVGKTKLVNEVLRPLALKKGFFVAGKFDQVHQDIPYAAFAQAFGNLVRQIMMENQDRLNAWKRRISEAVGRSGGTIAAVVPELELVIGRQPPAEMLQPKEAQNRFLMVFESFIGAFAGREHPLVVFLDDLQWADPASLHLIRYLCRGSENRYWLLVAAYRDNEVGESHPLAGALRDIRGAGMTVREVEVSPLGQPEVREYIDGTLHSPAEDLAQLSEVLYRKSGGNPLFLGQLAQTIYQDGLLRFSMERGRWEWDLAAVRRSPVEDSMLDFLIGRLRKLPEATRDVLKMAACLGNRFDLRTLSMVCEMTVDEAVAGLLPALEAGLLAPAGGTVDPGAEAGRGADWHEFVHDRVQQAAYAMVPDEEKGAVHLRIGRLMLRGAEPGGTDEALLPMMDHFNRGLGLVGDPAERLRLSELNLAAGRKAKGAAAYDSALRYLRAGMALLPRDSWVTQYELSYHLYFECAQCEYMSANMEAAERLFDEVLSRARTEIEKASVQASRLMLHAGMGHHERAIRIGVGALQRLGIQIVLKPSNLDYARELLAYKWFMLRRKPEDLERLPEMRDPLQKKAAELLIRLSCVASLGDSRLYGFVILKAANQAVRYGNSEMACIGYIGYSITAGSVLGDYAAGERFARVCINLAERYGMNSTRAVVYFTVGAIVSHWTQHESVGLKYLREAVRCGLDAGEVPVLGYAIGFIFENMYLMGAPLREVLDETEKAEAWARRMKHINLEANVAMYRRVVREMLGLPAAPDSGQAPAEGDEAVRATLCFLTMHSRFLRGDYRGAAAAAREVDDYAEVLMGFLISADCVLFQSLALAAVYGESSPAERRKCRRILKRNLRRMRKWSQACAANFLHKYALIDAEMARLRGRVEDAMALYDRSIQSAHDNGYVQNEAVASELAARCSVEAGRRRIAAMYLENARAAYRRWGSPVKVKDLEERYPDLLAASCDAETEGGAEEPGALAGVIAGIAAKAGGSSDEIDAKVVERAVRSLGRETDPDRLVEGLLEVAVESAGADRGYLILERDGDLFIEAAKEGAQRAATVVPPVQMEKSASLSRAMVRYSARTLESVMVNDRRDAGIFARDPYVAKNYPKSVMCLPVLLSKIPVGVLYLENSLMTGAFTQARVEVLKLLLSQMVYVRTLQVYLEGSTSGSEGDGRAALIEPLTDRESEVLRLVGAGLSNGEIADRLGMTVNTVKTHVKNIYGKLQVSRRVQAVARGRELGVL